MKIVSFLVEWVIILIYAKSSAINVRCRYPNYCYGHGVQMMRDDTVQSDVLRLKISGIHFLFLPTVAMKLSHTLLFDCLIGPGSYSCLQSP